MTGVPRVIVQGARGTSVTLRDLDEAARAHERNDVATGGVGVGADDRHRAPADLHLPTAWRNEVA